MHPLYGIVYSIDSIPNFQKSQNQKCMVVILGRGLAFHYLIDCLSAIQFDSTRRNVSRVQWKTGATKQLSLGKRKKGTNRSLTTHVSNLVEPYNRLISRKEWREKLKTRSNTSRQWRKLATLTLKLNGKLNHLTTKPTIIYQFGSNEMLKTKKLYFLHHPAQTA